MDPASFYTGLVAELYAPLRSETPDPLPYERFVRRYGEPALELACGDGDPLLDLVGQGLDVHGLDSSMDMLARCRARAAERGLHVTLHHQQNAVERAWLVHWHTPDGFGALAASAGLEVVGQRSLDGGPATASGTWTALLRRPGPV
jgi:cytosine/adenosine deaminase-related metal-dependent hydrolase